MMRMAQKGERCRILPSPGCDTLVQTNYSGKGNTRRIPARLDTRLADTGTVVGIYWNHAYTRKRIEVELDAPNHGVMAFRPGQLERISDNGKEDDTC